MNGFRIDCQSVWRGGGFVLSLSLASRQKELKIGSPEKKFRNLVGFAAFLLRLRGLFPPQELAVTVEGEGGKIVLERLWAEVRRKFCSLLFVLLRSLHLLSTSFSPSPLLSIEIH